MDITWHGDTSILIKEKGVNLVINPTKAVKSPEADLCLSSSELNEDQTKAFKAVFDWPGEYEVMDIPVTAIPALTKPQDESKSEPTLIFCFEVGDVKFCHLGELGHKLSNEMINEIGNVDVLMIKAGEGSNLESKKALEIIEAIEPRIVIPLGDASSATLKKELGAENTEAIDKFILKSRSELPESQMKYVVLQQS